MRPDRAYTHVRPPEAAQLKEYGARHHVSLTDDQAASLVPVIAMFLRDYDTLDELIDPAASPVPRRQEFGHTPTQAEDPFNAFVRICRVEGSESGPLVGKTVAVKDSLAVAGIPTTNGSRMLPTHTPTEDAVVVERLLAAGATIVGKTNMEDMAMGLGEGSAFGAARNALNPRFAPGGSSSGSAVAVASRAADIGIGVDEAGSIRIPASWSGVVGMKATHGLVPSYGLTYMDHTFDHIGPLTRTVADNAAVLSVIAGADPRDAQWVRDLPGATDYASEIGRDVNGLRIGVVAESLGPVGTTPDVLTAFDQACAVLRAAGARVETVSIPFWMHSWAIGSAIVGNGIWSMLATGGAGFSHKGRVDVAGVAHARSQLRNSGTDLALLTQLMLLTVEHDRDQYLGVHYAKALNLRMELKRQVTSLFAGFDVLITPTTPTVATELAVGRVPQMELIGRLVANAVPNSIPFDLTGNPAISVPCGKGENDLPIGLQIIGADFDEQTVYRVASFVESALDLRLFEAFDAGSNPLVKG